MIHAWPWLWSAEERHEPERPSPRRAARRARRVLEPMPCAHCGQDARDRHALVSGCGVLCLDCAVVEVGQ